METVVSPSCPKMGNYPVLPSDDSETSEPSRVSTEYLEFVTNGVKSDIPSQSELQQVPQEVQNIEKSKEKDQNLKEIDIKLLKSFKGTLQNLSSGELSQPDKMALEDNGIESILSGNPTAFATLGNAILELIYEKDETQIKDFANMICKISSKGDYSNRDLLREAIVEVITTEERAFKALQSYLEGNRIKDLPIEGQYEYTERRIARELGISFMKKRNAIGAFFIELCLREYFNLKNIRKYIESFNIRANSQCLPIIHALLNSCGKEIEGKIQELENNLEFKDWTKWFRHLFQMIENAAIETKQAQLKKNLEDLVLLKERGWKMSMQNKVLNHFDLKLYEQRLENLRKEIRILDQNQNQNAIPNYYRAHKMPMEMMYEY